MHPHPRTPTHPANGTVPPTSNRTTGPPPSAHGAALLALALQLAVLYAPRAPAAAATALPVDKLVHLAVFALPTAALIRAGMPRRWVIALMATHAPLSEHIQGRHLTGRSAERADVLADLVGVLLGTLASRTSPTTHRRPADDRRRARGTAE